MQWRPAGFAASISRISVRTGLPGTGIRPTAWVGISARTRLPRAGIRPTAWVGISARTRLPRAGIRPTAWLRISVRTRLPRAGIRPTASVKPAIRAGQWQHTLILRELLVVLVLLFAAGARGA